MTAFETLRLMALIIMILGIVAKVASLPSKDDARNMDTRDP